MLISVQKPMLNNKGLGLLPLLIGFAVVVFIGQQFILFAQQKNFETQLKNQKYESQMYAISTLGDILSDRAALRNSRFNTNSTLYQCLTGLPNPCNETQTYDMVLYAPNPPVTFVGGAWPSPPTGIARIAGGRTLNKLFLNRYGGLCTATLSEPNEACPMQAIIEFRPLCGGTDILPTFQATPGPCLGRATAIEIKLGVGIFKNGTFTYKGTGAANSDSMIVQLGALELLN